MPKIPHPFLQLDLIETSINIPIPPSVFVLKTSSDRNGQRLQSSFKLPASEPIPAVTPAMGHTSGQRFICTPYLYIWLRSKPGRLVNPKTELVIDVNWVFFTPKLSTGLDPWSIAISVPICAARLLEL